MVSLFSKPAGWPFFLAMWVDMFKESVRRLNQRGIRRWDMMHYTFICSQPGNNLRHLGFQRIIKFFENKGFYSNWCRWWDSNPHDFLRSQDFKSCASAISPHRLFTTNGLQVIAGTRLVFACRLFRVNYFRKRHQFLENWGSNYKIAGKATGLTHSLQSGRTGLLIWW